LPGGRADEGEKVRSGHSRDADERSIADRSKSALVPPVKTVEQVRRSNRSGRAE